MEETVQKNNNLDRQINTIDTYKIKKKQNYRKSATETTGTTENERRETRIVLKGQHLLFHGTQSN